MPYRRRILRRRRPKRKGGKVATKKYVKSVVKRAVQADPHHVDLQITDTIVQEYNAASPYMHPLLTTSVGDTQQSRDGKMIQCTGFSIRGSLYRNPASTSHDRVRVILINIKNTTSFTAAGIYSALYDTDLAVVSTGLSCFRRLDNGLLRNYQILYDKTFDLGYQTTDKSTKIFNIRRRFKRPIKCWYNTDASTVPTNNDLRLLAVSDSTANWPLLSTSSRAWFLP